MRASWLKIRHKSIISGSDSQSSLCHFMAFISPYLFVYLFVCFLQSLDPNLKQRSVVTPADLYSQFTPKQELKSMLRKPSSEGKKKQASKDQVALTEEVQAGTKKERTEKDFDLQKVIC